MILLVKNFRTLYTSNMNCFHCKEKGVSCYDFDFLQRVDPHQGVANMEIRQPNGKTLEIKRKVPIADCLVFLGRQTFEEYLPTATIVSIPNPSL